MNSSVDDVLVTHGGQLFAQVRRVLILDVLDDRFPAGDATQKSTSGFRYR